MTGAQLAHLAGLAAFAADFFATTDPAAARTFGEAALRADALSSELRARGTARPRWDRSAPAPRSAGQ